MIARIWHGYTTKENAPIYEQLLEQEIFPGIQQKNIPGYLGAQMFVREVENETEFTTQLWFQDLDSVKGFVGEDYESVYVPREAREVLSRFDQKAIHRELKLGPQPNF